MKRSVSILTNALKKEGFVIYREPFELNIIGIRADSVIPNRFDDVFICFYKDDHNSWQFHHWPGTTDPGTYWLGSPMNQKGTAILKGNRQYLAAYALGMHKSGYQCLKQVGPVTVVRDYNRDAVLDFFNGYEQTGSYAIEIHRAGQRGTTRFVEKYSAGCQVFANAQDYRQFIGLCKIHAKRHGNRFSYTLFDQRAIRRARKRRTIKAAAGVGVALFGGFQLLKWLNQSQNEDPKIRFS